MRRNEYIYWGMDDCFSFFNYALSIFFFAAYALDEGTLGDNVFLHLLAKTSYILRFPTNTLFFPGLVFNLGFHAFIIERGWNFISGWRQNRKIG